MINVLYSFERGSELEYKGMLYRRKCIFEYIGAIFSHILAKCGHNIQKMRFCQKAQGVNRLTKGPNFSKDDSFCDNFRNLSKENLKMSRMPHKSDFRFLGWYSLFYFAVSLTVCFEK